MRFEPARKSGCNPLSKHRIIAFDAVPERLPAGAGRIRDVLFEVLKYDVLRDGAVGG